MDGSQFDLLTRRFAAVRSRRGVLKGVLGGAVAAGIGAFRGLGAEGASCREVGSVCREDANCCSQICGPKDRTGRSYCACPPDQEECSRTCVDPAVAFQSDIKNCGACGNRCPNSRCQIATCDEGVCGLIPNPSWVGRSCDDDNRCTLDDVCQEDGSCAGTPKDCSALDDQCNTGVCNERTGDCESLPVANGTDCEEGDLCSVDDSCQDGVCEPGTPKTCPDRGPCFINPVCSSPSGECEYDEAPEGTSCSEDDEECVDGTCCSTSRRCPTQEGDLCCPSGQTCTTFGEGDDAVGICCDSDSDACLTISGSSPALICCPSGVPCQSFEFGEAIPFPIGVCCDGNACPTFTSSQGTPELEIVCCDSGEACAPVDLSSTPFGSLLGDVELGVCCPSGVTGCAEFSLLGGGGPQFNTTCCGVDETCQSVTFGPSGLLSASTCCATEVCPRISLGGTDQIIEAVCCASDTICTTVDLLGTETGQCCPPGDSLLVNPTTFQTSCCADPCIEFDGSASSFDPVCCSDSNQVCAAIDGFPVTPGVPGTFGKCCDDGQSACASPGPLTGSLALICCDTCQSLSAQGTTIPVCCPAGTVPELQTSDSSSAIVCVTPD